MVRSATGAQSVPTLGRRDGRRSPRRQGRAAVPAEHLAVKTARAISSCGKARVHGCSRWLCSDSRPDQDVGLVGHRAAGHADPSRGDATLDRSSRWFTAGGRHRTVTWVPVRLDRTVPQQSSLVVSARRGNPRTSAGAPGYRAGSGLLVIPRFGRGYSNARRLRSRLLRQFPRDMARW